MAKNSPGKGTRVSYDFSEICKWALYLELSAFGVDPSRNAKTIDFWWPRIGEEIVGFEGDGNLFLLGIPNGLTAERINDLDLTEKLFISPIALHMPKLLFSINVLELEYLSRLIVINVGLMRRKLVDALSR